MARPAAAGCNPMLDRRCVAKTLIANPDKCRIRPKACRSGHDNPRVVQCLNRMNERRSVVFAQDVRSDLNRVGGTQPDKPTVKRRVMQSAQGQAIPDVRFTLGFVVWHDMSGVEQLLVTEPAERALPLVRVENALAKGTLM